jgi:hypothetical protein
MDDKIPSYPTKGGESRTVAETELVCDHKRREETQGLGYSVHGLRLGENNG